MAIEGISPNIKRAAQEFRYANATRGWVYDFPDLNGRSQQYEALHSATNRRPPDAILHLQIALIRQLAEIVDLPSNSKLTFNGRPRVGEVLVVDGTQQQANVRQVMPVNSEHADHISGAYELSAPVRYMRGAQEVKRNVGYNVVMIADEASSLPLVQGVFPANIDERKAVLMLLELLFRIWPDCPAKYMVGDSLFDHSKSFARELELRWRIHPIFPMHGGRSKAKAEHGATNGVPRCAHGLMKGSPEGFVSEEEQVRNGIPRGSDPPLDYNPRIRYTCPAEICKNIDLKVRDDPWWNRYIPMAGDHRLRYFGAALISHRNVIESIYAELQMLGFWGPGQNRPKWAKTFREVGWAYMLPMAMLVAKRLAHATGLYDAMLQEATLLDLLTPPTTDRPTPGPDALSLAAARERLPVNPQPPGTWSELYANERLT